MSPLRDEELLRDPTIRRAVELRRAEARRAAASAPVQTRSRRWQIRWLVIITIGVLLVAIAGLIRLTH
jgi:hypothetical protein